MPPRMPSPEGPPGSATPKCPACHQQEVQSFYTLEKIPLQSCVLLRSSEAALAYPTGDLRLVVCRSCGFIFNEWYDAKLQGPLDEYEASQAFSPRFTRFMDELSELLVGGHCLSNQRVLEIGCGAGDFLRHICRAGNNAGIGFDPTCVRSGDEPASGEVALVDALYDEKAFGRSADAIVCRHTLEHIPDVLDFLRMVRRACDAEGARLVFFEVPDTLRVLEEAAFWDVYYEHCSYFCQGSLEQVFRQAGFIIRESRRVYDDQYLVIVAEPGDEVPPQGPPRDLERVLAATSSFANKLETLSAKWATKLETVERRGGTTVVWGAGSKAAGFFAAKIGGQVRHIVDVNPRKQGMFQAGSGQRIIAPEDLTDIAPDTVIMMNPIYRDEVGAKLAELGLHPELLAL